MSTQEKIIAARRITRLQEQKEAIMAFLHSNDVKTGKCIKISYDSFHSVTIDGAAFELICTELEKKINQINQEIYDTELV